MHTTRFYKKTSCLDYNNIVQSAVAGRARKVIDAIEKNNETIKFLIPNWYSYECNYGESGTNSIPDDHLYDEDGSRVSDSILWYLDVQNVPNNGN